VFSVYESLQRIFEEERRKILSCLSSKGMYVVKRVFLPTSKMISMSCLTI